MTPFLRFVGAVAAMSLAILVCSTVASCGSSDGRSGDGVTSATATSTGRDAALFAALPTVNDIGRGYRIEKSSRTDPPEPFDPATTTTTTATRFNIFDKFCPGSRWPRLGAHPDVAGVEYIQFMGKDDRELSVGLAPVPPSLDQAGMDRLMKAINACGTFKDENGAVVNTHTVRAEAVRGVGDYGLDIRWQSATRVEGQEDLPMDVDTSTRTYLLVVDDVLVAVEAGGGFDLDKMTALSADDDLVPAVAQTTAQKLNG